MMKFFFVLLVCIAFLVSMPVSDAFSQEAIERDSSEDDFSEMQLERMRRDISELARTLEIQKKLTSVDVDIEGISKMNTVFFTLWQHLLLQEAKRGIILSVQDPDCAPGETNCGAQISTRPRGLREISLSGIAYNSVDKWTVWLNGKRITPDAFPKEVRGLKVTKDHIDLKWYDIFSDKIYPIRLRPHQRFNLDSRIFLPGISTGQ